MNVLFSGSVDGEILDFYSQILEFEKEHKYPVDWIFCVGNFGIWPDPQAIDRGTKISKKTAGDFPYLYLNQWSAPRQTVVIEGIHEDHDWIEKRISTGNLELIPNVALLANGSHLNIDGVNITGVGKSYSEQVYLGNRKSNRNYSVQDIANAAVIPSNIVLTYEPPNDSKIHKYKSIAKGITEILERSGASLHVHSTPYHGVHVTKLAKIISVALGKRQIFPVQIENDKNPPLMKFF